MKTIRPKKKAPASKASSGGAAYEKLAAQLRAMGVHVPPKRAYMKTFGLAKNDPTFPEAMRLGAEWRAEVNRQSMTAAKS